MNNNFGKHTPSENATEKQENTRPRSRPEQSHGGAKRRGKTCGTPEKSRTRLSRRPPAVDVETGNENDGPIPGNGRTDTGGRDGSGEMQDGEEQWEAEHRPVPEQFPTMQEVLWVTFIHGTTEGQEGEPERRPRTINHLADSLIRAANLAGRQ